MCDRDLPATDFLLVHGGWHSSASWTTISPLLSKGSSSATAIDLPGAGLTVRLPSTYLDPGQPGLAHEVSPIRDITLDETAGVVVDALRALRDTASAGRRTVLVGHSLGGAAITRAAELAPELIDHLVYLAAMVPTTLQTSLAYLGLPEAGVPHPDLHLGDATVTGAVRINPRSGDPAYQELLRSTFYGDVDRDVFRGIADTLSPDLPARVAADAAGATPERWGTIPRTYIKTLRDRALSPALQQRMIDDADSLTVGNPFHRVLLDSDHSPFVSRPEELATLLWQAASSAAATETPSRP